MGALLLERFGAIAPVEYAQAAIKKVAKTFWVLMACWSAVGALAAPDGSPVCPPPGLGQAQSAADKHADASTDTHTDAQSTPNRGFLWRLHKGGHSSYLYGTLHVGRPHWTTLGPQLQQALEATDLVALEIDAQDPAVQQAMAQGIAAMPRTALPAPQRQRLMHLLEVHCLPASAADQLPAPLLVVMLALEQARQEGLDGEFGSEALLGSTAHTLQRRVVSLETVQQQLDALFDKDPRTQRQQIQESLDMLESDQARRILRELVGAWERSDFSRLSTYAQWCQCVNTPLEKAQMRRLLDARNPAMARRVDALHAQGHRVLVAVGALHMAGPKGLPALLQKKGYVVERLH
jgi:uncharacterized protein